jgi:2-polyprenyl-3-methyl-5-hydroxy-6-metoxy-1,4-benzoquinol methylase
MRSYPRWAGWPLRFYPDRPVSQATESTSVGETRFGFGENWSRFASDIPPARIDAARTSLAETFGRDSLEGKAFLDLGSGSGLFSLAAVLLGARRVHSIDLDELSVATTTAVRDAFAHDADWTVEQANVLDAAYMERLGGWDLVYAWGVLHHTGDMWSAMDHACGRVATGGRLFISIYNDQGWRSRLWRRIKRLYNALPGPVRAPYAVVVMLPMEINSLVRYALKLRPYEYLRQWWAKGGRERGMSRWHDVLDWVGGFPCEVATPDEVFEFCRARGFELVSLRTVGGSHGCNEFLFESPPASGPPRT